jgi:hypothetical protein
MEPIRKSCMGEKNETQVEEVKSTIVYTSHKKGKCAQYYTTFS